MLYPFLSILVPLLFAHLLADFILQSDESVRKKGKLQVLLRHGLVTGLLSYFFLGQVYSWQIPLGIAVSHTLLDAWKLRSRKGSRLSRFLLDQAGHILVLILLAWAASNSPLPGPQIWLPVFGKAYLVVLAFLCGAILTVYVGSFIVELAFDSLGLQAEKPSGERDAQPEAAPDHAGIAAGGRVIGYLERGLIYIFILAGYPAGIGFLVAAKSIYRFGELTDSSRRSQAEYIIIGTLLSILFGTGTAYAAEAVLKLLLY